MTFSSLGLAETLVRAVSEHGYTVPTPIQIQAIPAVLEGRDLMASAQTGTGKTAAFTLPLLQRLATDRPARPGPVRALILTPTRELAAQVGASVTTYGKHLPLRSSVVFGGVNINPQITQLRRGVDVLTATPGRLLDLYQRGAVRFDALDTLVLDEADRMLDMGFIHDIRRIIALLPRRRQNLMFSATFSGEIRTLARDLLHQPVQIDVSPRQPAAETVHQQIYPVDKGRKPELLSRLVRDHDWQQVLVFTRTKHGANRLAQKLERDGIDAGAIHGNKSQNARTQALDQFKRGGLRVLVATDIAARGLDIDQLPQVVNFELPNVAEDYVHRIGRTGRAGSNGHAVSLVSPDEHKLLTGIERLLRQTLPRTTLQGFEPGPAEAAAPSPRRPVGRRTPASRGVPKPPGASNRPRATGNGRRPQPSGRAG